ncbi:MAG: hypothetical protein H6811_02015 [Phycisphaeraceae bacterium]|nr:hypothetical protein [Phycisphaeraceae bacterium]
MTTATIPFTNTNNFQGINVPNTYPNQTPWTNSVQPNNAFSPYAYQNSYVPFNGNTWTPNTLGFQPIQTLNTFGVPFGGFNSQFNPLSSFGSTYPTPISNPFGWTNNFSTPFGGLPNSFSPFGNVATPFGGQINTLNPLAWTNWLNSSYIGGVHGTIPFQQFSPVGCYGHPSQNVGFNTLGQIPGAWSNPSPFGLTPTTINSIGGYNGLTSTPFVGQPFNTTVGVQSWNTVGQPWNTYGFNTFSPINGYPYGVTPNFVPGYQPAQNFANLVTPAYGYNPAVNCDKTQNLNLNAKAA